VTFSPLASAAVVISVDAKSKARRLIDSNDEDYAFRGRVHASDGRVAQIGALFRSRFAIISRHSARPARDRQRSARRLDLTEQSLNNRVAHVETRERGTFNLTSSTS